MFVVFEGFLYVLNVLSFTAIYPPCLLSHVGSLNAGWGHWLHELHASDFAKLVEQASSLQCANMGPSLQRKPGILS